MIAGHRHAAPHQQFVAGAAQPDQVDTAGTVGTGQFHQFRLGGRLDHHVRQQRIMAMEGDIDLVFPQNPEVDLGHDGRRCAEENVGQLSGDHRATPAVRQAGAKRVQQKVDVVVVHAHVSAVQHLHVLAVDAPWDNPCLCPPLAPRLWHLLDEGNLVLTAAVVFEEHLGDRSSHLHHGALAGLNAKTGRQPAQLLLVGDAVASSLAESSGPEHFEDVAAVVRVRRGTRGDRAAQVAGHDHVGVSATHALLRSLPERVDAAWAHRAVPAAHAERAVSALGLLGGQAIPDCLDALVARECNHLLGVGIDAQPRRRTSAVSVATEAHRVPPWLPRSLPPD